MAKFNDLDDIFSDEAFDSLVASLSPKVIERIDPEIEKFQEIVDWVRKYGIEPKKTTNIKERRLASRLEGLRKDKERMVKLKPYDIEFNLLNITEEPPKSLDDIFSDNSLFEEDNFEKKLFDVSRYKRTIQSADKLSVRKRVRTDFEAFDRIFKKVHADIASGKRKIKRISESEISQASPIQKGNFYIDNGIMLYVAKIYNPENGKEVSASTNREYKIHTIYENGTENHIWLLSLVSSLYDKTRSGRLVTEKIDDISLVGEKVSPDITTGIIYVVKYAGKDRRFLQMKNLYKIGVATNIERRLSNTQNEATYLYAPVKIVAEFEIQNVNAQKVEKYLHDVFAEKRARLTVIAPNGKTIEATEWFLVSLDEITEKINQMVTQIQ